MTPDLKYAKVYVSVLGPEEQWASSLEALESARGFVWNWLRRHLDLRVTPAALVPSRPLHGARRAHPVAPRRAARRVRASRRRRDVRAGPDPRRCPPLPAELLDVLRQPRGTGADARPRPSGRRRARHAPRPRAGHGDGGLVRDLRRAAPGARVPRLSPGGERWQVWNGPPRTFDVIVLTDCPNDERTEGLLAGARGPHSRGAEHRSPSRTTGATAPSTGSIRRRPPPARWSTT